MSGGSTAAVAVAMGCGVAAWAVYRRVYAARGLETAPPHPHWSPPDKMPMPFADDAHESFDPAALASCYPLMISAFVPRPIAFVSTLSDSFGGNLAPFSYAGLFNHDPPTIGFSVCANPAAADRKKDTLANIDESGEFVVHIMSEWYVEAANHCCGAFARDLDEFDLSGLTRLPSARVRPPRVKEAAVAFECKLAHRHEMRNAKGEVSATLVLGEVQMVHVARAACELEGAGPGKPTVNFARLAPLSRLGGNTYGRTSSTFDLPRPDRSVRST
jgi:flavin reductase (DIM6/NTAB) family NADH-FMN oxidoreductase RutF